MPWVRGEQPPHVLRGCRASRSQASSLVEAGERPLQALLLLEHLFLFISFLSQSFKRSSLPASCWRSTEPSL